MKTIRTRVTSALRRNSKPTPAPPAPLKLPAASTSAPSLLLEKEKANGTAAPPVSPVTPTEKERYNPAFRLEEEPRSESPVQDDLEEKPKDFDLSGLKFTGNEPEEIYVQSQTIPITDDSKRSSRRSTPKKRIKSVPRLSSDSYFPSPSIASRIQTTLPPEDTEEEEIKFVSPVDPNYLIDEAQAEETFLLDQPAPTEPSYVELTPKEMSSSLPPLHEILAHQAHLKRLDSGLEVPRAASVHDKSDLEEKQPLLDASLLTTEVDEILDSVWPLPPPTFPALGWTEHVLPSSAYYYSHAATRTVTDVDLRDEKKLAAVKSYIKSKLSTPKSNGELPLAGSSTTLRDLRSDSMSRVEEGVDLWLRDANPAGFQTKGPSDWEFMPMRSWVLHASRAVTFDPPSDRDGYQAPEELSDEDRLDLENRYWQYMSTHPAHAALPQTAFDEAMEVVTWCYTDRVLQATQPFPVPPPFTQRECVELLELLRSMAASNVSGSNSVVRTRLVAQILLRYTEWRQRYVVKTSQEKTLNNPLGTDTKVVHAIPYRRTISRFVKTILCLGIPYLLESHELLRGQTSDRPTDEEDQADTKFQRWSVSGLGGSQPLVAALLLSASVTFLTLSGLNETARIAASISALCASASMVSYMISLYQRAHLHLSRSRGVIIASLPLVMLAYSLCAFITGVIAYSVAGSAASSNRAEGFGRYTGWVVVAVWIALVAALVASAATAMKKGL